MINPRPLRIAHVMMIRLSHALDSSTVFPDLEKFIKSKATDAVTTAAMGGDQDNLVIYVFHDF